jgi:hypothetical protein
MKMTIVKGKRIFHATTRDSAISILTGGLDTSVVNQWGGGEFGPGFYTATTRDGAALYTNPREVVIEFKVVESLGGIAMEPPRFLNPNDEKLRRGCVDYDFITRLQQSPPLEYKINYRSYDDLMPLVVHIWHGSEWASYAPVDGLEQLGHQAIRSPLRRCG